MTTPTRTHDQLTVATLNPEEHDGVTAVVDGREGRLSWSTVPAYHRFEVGCWYLVVPSRLKDFDEESISLQWAKFETVTLL